MFVRKSTKLAETDEELETMQISRHWRLNAQRYRLQGVRYENGEVSLQNRPSLPQTQEQPIREVEATKKEKLELKAAS